MLEHGELTLCQLPQNRLIVRVVEEFVVFAGVVVTRLEEGECLTMRFGRFR